MSKTAVTLLEEHCAKFKKEKARYIFLDENEDKEEIEDLDDADKGMKFYCKCIALQQQSIKGGLAKKDAKQNAAASVIIKAGLSGDNSVLASDINFTNNAICTLMDVCVLRNLEKPEFFELDASGPSHAPIFTMMCKVSSLKTTGQDSAKKRAKQICAALMLEKINKVYPENCKKLAPAGVNFETETKQKIKTYLDWKKQDESQKKELGIKMKDRHKFFENFEDEDKKQIVEMLQNNLTTDTYKYLKLKALFEDLKGYSSSEEAFNSSQGVQMKLFNLTIDYDQFTFLWLDDVVTMHHNVVQYFKVMFGLIDDFKQLNILPYQVPTKP